MGIDRGGRDQQGMVLFLGAWLLGLVELGSTGFTGVDIRAWEESPGHGWMDFVRADRTH